MRYKCLLAPGKIGTLEVKNRAIMAPMSAALANTDGTVTDELIAYLTERARGGIGLILTEYAYVQESGKSSDHQISAADDGINASAKSRSRTPTVEINGGDITVSMASGDTDGIDSNGNIFINGGTVTVTGSSTFDYDGTGVLSGGTLILNGQAYTGTTLPNQMMGGGGRGGWGNPGSQGTPGGQGNPGGQGDPGGQGNPGGWGNPGGGRPGGGRH